MDIIHHLMVGLAGDTLATTFGQPDLGLGFLVGSVLPDADIVFVALGKTRYIRLHQGPTHSFFIAPLLAVAVAATFSCAGADLPAATHIGAGVLFGCVWHAFLDMLNTFGVALFWPFGCRHRKDILFVFDAPTFSAVALLDFLSYHCRGSVAASAACLAAYLLFFAARVAAMAAWTSRVRIASEADIAIPHGLLPFTANLTRIGDDAFSTGTAKGLRPRVEWSGSYPRHDSALTLCRLGPHFRLLEKSLRLLRPVTVETCGSRTRIVSRCLAIRNYGNKFGSVETIVENGVLVSEKALI